MNALPIPGRNARAALLALQRLLADADRALSSSDVDAAETALGRVRNAFEQYRRGQDEDVNERAIQTALEAARRVAGLTLTRLLGEVDALLAAGDQEGVKAALKKANEVVEAVRVLDESANYSGVRRRFPSK